MQDTQLFNLGEFASSLKGGPHHKLFVLVKALQKSQISQRELLYAASAHKLFVSLFEPNQVSNFFTSIGVEEVGAAHRAVQSSYVITYVNAVQIGDFQNCWMSSELKEANTRIREVRRKVAAHREEDFDIYYRECVIIAINGNDATLETPYRIRNSTSQTHKDVALLLAAALLFIEKRIEFLKARIIIAITSNKELKIMIKENQESFTFFPEKFFQDMSREQYIEVIKKYRSPEFKIMI